VDQDLIAKDPLTSGVEASGAEAFGVAACGARSQEQDGDRAALEARIERAVADFQHGVDREASFRVLFDSFYEPTRHFLARRVSSPEDRLDLTQETFLRVYRGLEGYRGEAQFGTWVFRIAFNTYLKWLRRSQTDDQDPDGVKGVEEALIAWEDEQPIAVSTEPSPLDHALQSERRTLLRHAIEELPEQMRRCIELRVYQGLSYREIAVVMRRSIETVKVHLFQARKKLKGLLDEDQP